MSEQAVTRKAGISLERLRENTTITAVGGLAVVLSQAGPNNFESLTGDDRLLDHQVEATCEGSELVVTTTIEISQGAAIDFMEINPNGEDNFVDSFGLGSHVRATNRYGSDRLSISPGETRGYYHLIDFSDTDNYDDVIESPVIPVEYSCDNGGTGGPKRPIENIETIAGADRIETAVKVSQNSYNQADIAVIATGENWPDALAGGPLTAFLDGPLLLTRTDGLHSATAEELRRLGTKRVYLLGGEAAIDASVESELRSMGIEVIRIAGANRFETATEIAEFMYVNDDNSKDEKPKTSKDVYIVSGHDFPDAVSASAPAARTGSPILPVSGPLPSSTVEFLQRYKDRAERVIVIGGSAAVAGTVEQQAKNAAAASSIRLSGPDRFSTSAAVAEFDLNQQDQDLQNSYVATGLNFPDALTVGPAVASEDGAALLLVHGTSTSEVIHKPFDQFAKNNKTIRWETITRVGGKKVVRSETLTLLAVIASSHDDNPPREPLDNANSSSVFGNATFSAVYSTGPNEQIGPNTEKVIARRDQNGKVKLIVVNRKI